MVKKDSYEELSRAKVSDNRSVVISERSSGGYTIAQQLETVDGDRTMSVYLKGAIHVKDKDALVDLRDAVNLALECIEQKALEPNWD